MSAIKTQQTDDDVQEFMNSIEDPKKQEDCKKIFEWMSKVTGETPKVWSHGTIGFGEYEYSAAKGIAKWYLMGFSPRKQNISIHIMQGFDKLPDKIEKLGKFKNGRSCLYINKLEDVDTTVLQEIISESWDVVKDYYPPIKK